MATEKTAVVLFNLGGPDSPEAVAPFLYNLFKDPAIIRLPGIVRIPLAKLISRRRAPIAQEIYKHIGGASPLLEQTQEQAQALEDELKNEGEFKVFTVMRYWHPMADDVAQQVKTYAPDRIVLLPLYPQFSTTTTQSSFRDWDRAAQKADLQVPTKRICCYPDHEKFISAYAKLIAPLHEEASKSGPVRILFSAHGLPEKISRDGDPYEAQVYAGAQAIIEQLGSEGETQIDHLVCFQSRVGPLKWIGPSTDEAIIQAGVDGVGVLIVPIAFVSEHSETLVELDIEYRDLAREHGIEAYMRVPTVGTEPDFIDCLQGLVMESLASENDVIRGALQGCNTTDHACPCNV